VNTSSSNAAGSSSDTEPCVEVFIADINTESVAGIDGRLRKGDQILQVNGRDVTNREETELLFAENKNAVTLLVSRCIQYSNVRIFEGFLVQS
jgi:ligand of Numb protein X 3/4